MQSTAVSDSILCCDKITYDILAIAVAQVQDECNKQYHGINDAGFNDIRYYRAVELVIIVWNELPNFSSGSSDTI